MKLITKEIEKRFREVGRQDIPNPIVIAKFFNPSGAATWYATEYTEDICFGYVTGLGFDELGSFSITELESIKCPPFGLPIERDLHCGEKRLVEHCPELAESIKRQEELRALEAQKEKSRNNNLER
jgi:hypothetical protein